MARELFGIAPRELPAGIWPTSPVPPPPSAPAVEAAPVEPRRAPVASGEVPSGVTIIRPIKVRDEK